MKRSLYIDVLKAVAIVAVVFYHIGYLTYGYLGVELFLVVNGFLITKSLNKRILQDSTALYPHYFIKTYFSFMYDKILRLLPVLLAGMLLCLSWGYFCMLPDDYENLSQSVIASSLFSNNILQAITTRDYWDVVNDYKPLMHTWYIGVVMQFYLFYPILFLFAKKISSKLKDLIAKMLILLSIVSLFLYLGCTDDAMRFYYLPFRFFEFGFGGILALYFNSKGNNKVISDYTAIALLVAILVLLVSNAPILSIQVRFLSVVCLSVCLILSQKNLECSFLKTIIANPVLAIVGKMSYSIFIWHQIILAFYRYSFTCKFTPISLLIYIVVTLMISALSYYFIENKVSSLVKKYKILFPCVMLSLLVLVDGVSVFIYKRGGVTRDVPELDIVSQNAYGGQHAAYCDRANNYDKEFKTTKDHWLIIGNSFGRDFVNVVLESEVADLVEISYSKEEYAISENCNSRYKNADKVFVSTLGVTPEFVSNISARYRANNPNGDQIIVVGEKNFGENNGQIYWHHNQKDYFSMCTNMIDGYQKKNNKLKELYGDSFIDLMSYVLQGDNSVRVFTDNHKYISSDCRHLTRAGAIFYAERIPLKIYLNNESE